MAVKMRPARMSSAEYWRRRESQRRKERIADEKERAKLLQEIYRTAVDQMTREVESFFQRYARAEQITLADARRRVSLLDMKEYERLAKQYVELKDFSPEANRQMKLYNLTMKANRLELLRNRLGLEMVKMTNDTQTEISRALVERSLETFEEYAGILGESVRDPLALAATISQEPFKGAKWSERLWGTNQKGLYDSVTRTLENALISGKNARQLASSLRKQYGRSLYEAERLMVTEMARCQTEAAKLSMEANENEYYMVLTANAMGPCGDCSDLEDQTTRDPIPVKDMEPGVNAPPLHPSCHCATAPWWDEKKYQKWMESGAARVGEEYEEHATAQINGTFIDDMVVKMRKALGASDAAFEDNVKMLKDELAFETVDNSLRHCDQELLKDNIIHVKKLENRFSAIRRSVDTKVWLDVRESAFAYTKAYPNSRKQSLVFCAPYLDREEMIQKIGKGQREKRFMPTDSSDATLSVYAITHEYGHLLQHILYITAKDNGYNKSEIEFFEDCKNDIVMIAQNNNPRFDLKKCESGQSQKSASEFFAEVFANSQLGKPNDLGSAMEKWLQYCGY